VKLLVFVFAFVLTVAVYANPIALIPQSMAHPEFPEELLQNRHAGKVIVYIEVGSSGTVQTARVLESSHPQFTEAAKRALVQWRYEPWDANTDAPSKLGILVPVIFGARGLKPFSPHVTVGLGNILCAYLNYEVKASKRDYPEDPLSKVDVFWYTGQHVSSSYVRQWLPEESQRKALYGRLVKSIPAVVKKCRRNPDSRYGEHLVQEIRALLPEVVADKASGAKEKGGFKS
jgi:TonB family protein